MGAKLYELTDHLGNVRAVIGDLKLADGSSYKVDLKSYTNYYPYGMVQPLREWTQGGNYRYGYNGMEEDNEVKGENNSLSTYYRLYDPRLGLWLGIDPVVHECESPYSAMNGNPILFADPSGAEGEIQEFTSDEKNPNKNKDLANLPEGSLIKYNGVDAQKINGKWARIGKTSAVDIVESKPSAIESIAQGVMDGLSDNLKGIVEHPDEAVKSMAMGMIQPYVDLYKNPTDIESYLKLVSHTMPAMEIAPVVYDVSKNLWAGDNYGAGRVIGEKIAQKIIQLAVILATEAGSAYFRSLNPRGITKGKVKAQVVDQSAGSETLNDMPYSSPSQTAPAQAAKGGSNIALGVREHLGSFAIKVGGTTWETWGTKNFQSQFLETITNSANKIHFNLDGIPNVWKAVGDGAKGFGKSEHVTSWELYQIYSNPGALQRTTFYLDGKVVPSPF